MSLNPVIVSRLVQVLQAAQAAPRCGKQAVYAAACAELARRCHALGLNVWTYSGYTYEQLAALINATGGAPVTIAYTRGASAGRTVWIDDEARMDAVTGVSGSGPAYVFLLAEAMEAAAIKEGLAPDAARTLVLQTVLGAARMLTESDVAPEELRRRVTSPNGTTQAAVETFQAGGLETLVAAAIHAATVRGQ